MRLETIKAYKHMLSVYGPGRAARLMRLSPDEEREAIRILRAGENEGGTDARQPMARAWGADAKAR